MFRGERTLELRCILTLCVHSYSFSTNRVRSERSLERSWGFSPKATVETPDKGSTRDKGVTISDERLRSRH